MLTLDNVPRALANFDTRGFIKLVAEIALWMVLLTVSYTILSERINLARGGWAYAPLMPVIPWVGVGLSPLLQWLFVPVAVWRWAQPSPSS